MPFEYFGPRESDFIYRLIDLTENRSFIVWNKSVRDTYEARVGDFRIYIFQEQKTLKKFLTSKVHFKYILSVFKNGDECLKIESPLLEGKEKITLLKILFDEVRANFVHPSFEKCSLETVFSKLSRLDSPLNNFKGEFGDRP